MENIATDERRSSKVLNCKTASVKFSLVAEENYFVSNETIKEKFNEFCFQILNTTWNRWLYWLMSGSMRSLQRKSEGRQGENFSRVSHCQMSLIHSIQRYTCVAFSLPLVISLNVISSISMIFPVWTYKYTYKLCLNFQLFEHFYYLNTLILENSGNQKFECSRTWNLKVDTRAFDLLGYLGTRELEYSGPLKYQKAKHSEARFCCLCQIRDFV